MTGFKHGPINLERPSIRLLMLYKDDPCDISSKIRCELFLAEVKGGFEYEALSYTWGSSEKTAQIYVNDCQMGVTENLWTALRHLRLPRENRILWIDAICIDQDNHEERGHQIRQMGAIYKQAHRVIIWLGHGTTETDVIMEFMRQRELSTNRCQQQIDLSIFQSDDSMVEERQAKGLHALLCRSWFRRIWILQEVANARSALVVCGMKSVSARTFASVPRILKFTPEPHVQAVLDIMPGLRQRTSWLDQKPTLQTLLQKFRNSEATQPQDRIFAVLGMSCDANSSDIVFPDYSKSSEQIVQETVSFLLGSSTFDALSYNFLCWTINDFFEHLPFLHLEIFKLAWKVRRSMAETMLQDTRDYENEMYHNKFESIISWVLQKGDKNFLPALIRPGKVTFSFGHFKMAWRRSNSNVMVEEMIKMESLVYLDTNPSDTPFVHLAVKGGYLELLRLLLEHEEFEVDMKDNNGRTPLWYAVVLSNPAILDSKDMVKMLLAQSKTEVDFKDRCGRTPLLYASGLWEEKKYASSVLGTGIPSMVNSDYLEMVQLLLMTDKVDVNVRDEVGMTPLVHACLAKNEEAAKLLIAAKGIDLIWRNHFLEARLWNTPLRSG